MTFLSNWIHLLWKKHQLPDVTIPYRHMEDQGEYTPLLHQIQQTEMLLFAEGSNRITTP